VNHGSYLRDETGGRRFWPVECRRIDLDRLKEDRDQIWAEAVALYRAGQAWWLDSSELNAAAAAEQSARFEGDPWDDRIASWIQGKLDVSIDEILTHCLGKEVGHWSQVDKNRVSRVLRAANWYRFNSRLGSSREWRYRPVSEVDPIVWTKIGSSLDREAG
jgi:putative DNA primase/helicase